MTHEVDQLRLAIGAALQRWNLADHPVHVLESVTSTNTWLLDRLESGTIAPPVTAVALEQTVGRGRLGRRWETHRGRSLILTWAPPVDPARPLLPAAAYAITSGLAARAMCAHCGLDVRLKWPNDIMVGRRKLGGILVESRMLASRAPVLAIGLGINVDERPEELPRPEDYEATSIRVESGISWPIADLAARLIHELTQRFSDHVRDPATQGRDYLEALGLGGREVVVRAGSETHRGNLRDLHPEHGLTLRFAAGDLVRIPLETIRTLAPQSW